MKKKILVIVGPTASGKSGLAVRLAKKLDGEIVSADSRQVYKGLNIGSGKITKSEMQRVKHHLLDVVDPKKQFSASDYKKLAEEALQYIVGQDKLPIVVGGTGFYIDTLTGALNLPEVPPNKKLREKLSKLTTEKLFATLHKKDPARAKTIDIHNRVRLIRALEIVEALGKVPPLRQGYTGQAPYTFVWVGIKPNDIDKKIRIRLEKRLPGIIREVRRLHNPPVGRGLSYKRMYELGLEYRYVSEYVQGKLSREEMVEKLYIQIRRYAKRQMTYWKRNKKIRWFSSKDYREIEKFIQTRI